MKRIVYTVVYKATTGFFVHPERLIKLFRPDGLGTDKQENK